MTPFGVVPIEAVRPGDAVLAIDPAAEGGRGALVPPRVARLFANETAEWLRLSWKDADGAACGLSVTPAVPRQRP